MIKIKERTKMEWFYIIAFVTSISMITASINPMINYIVGAFVLGLGIFGFIMAMKEKAQNRSNINQEKEVGK